MKKLTLKVEALQVETFEAAKATEERGTVQAAASGYTCPKDCTEAWSCGIWCPPTQDPGPSEPCYC